MRKVFYVFGFLDDADIEWMARNGRSFSLDESSILIRQGVPIDELYILLEGRLSVHVGSNSGQLVAVLEPGEILGEISFVDNRLPTASVTALEASRLLGLPKPALLAKLQRDVGFAARFYRAVAWFLADRLALTTSRFGYGDPSQDEDPTELSDANMTDVSMAAIRFDKLLRYLGEGNNAGSFAAVK